MLNPTIRNDFFKNKQHAFIWSVLFLSPILGWLSVLVLGLVGLSQLRFWREIKFSFQNRSFLIAGAIILLYLITLFTFGRVHEFGLKALKFPAGLLVPFGLLVWFNKKNLSENVVSTSAVYAVIVISMLMGLEWLVYKLYFGVDARVRGLSANPLFVSAMLLPLQLLAIHNFKQATRAFKKIILLSWLMGLICLAMFLGARSSFMIMLGLSFISFFLQTEGYKNRLKFIFTIVILVSLLGVFLYYQAENISFFARMKMLLDFTTTLDVSHIQDESMQLRLSAWQAAWQAIVQQPWLGYGFAQERVALAQYLPQSALVLPTSHQEYLSFMLGAGVFGLISGVLYLLFPLLAIGLSNPKRRLALCLVAPFLLNAFTDTLLDDLRIIFYYTTIGLLLISVKVQRE
ncbi:MAG: O-antigen ligase family protein [Methylotenera sp.]|nr:O-antigen ligase family protein [Methylotenera sp.]